ncbi:MAG: acyl-CoA dehydrogenase, partial [Planctomycetes bacterium]|nr:acyl-CoA dehydrogenase [Planctomycetota bacterium]
APKAAEVDEVGAQLHDGKVRYAPATQDALRQLTRADLTGFTLPRKHGGLNMPVLIYSMAIEMVARADASLMTIFGLQDIADTINLFADEATKAKYLPKFASGNVLGAMVLTEPDAGSDLQAVRLKAAYDEAARTWYLDGVKRFITNGCAEVLLVLARSEHDIQDGRGLSLFLCEAGPGVRVRRLEDKLGIHGSPTCELSFNHAPAQLIGKRRRGLIQYVASLMDGARLAIAAQGIGIAQAAFGDALEYASQREQFSVKIRDFPALREMLGNMHVKVDAARLFVYDTACVVDMAKNIARLKDSGELARFPNADALKQSLVKWEKLASALTPMAKYYATEICNQVCYDAIQVLGGSGYMRDYNLERFYRDARITNIYEGTSQLQIVAAIGPVLAGTMEQRYEELHKLLLRRHALSQALTDLAKARKRLQEVVAHIKALNDRRYTDLNARRIVDIAIDIYLGYLFLDQSTKSIHKEVLAKKFLNDALPRVEMNAALVLSGDRTFLDRTLDLIGYL